MLLLSDSCVLNTPLMECGEPLVDVFDGFVARASVAAKLRAAQSSLPDGLRLRINDGYRSAEDQQNIIDQYRWQVRVQRPDLTGDAFDAAVSEFVSPLAVAPHVSGAAVDVTIAQIDGDDLWMGTAIDDTPQDSAGRCFTDADVDPVARQNRDLLRQVMEAVGMVNYPTEWWHWSYGDRYWAVTTAAPHAIYGPLSELAQAS